MSINPNKYREALSLFPSGVTVITTSAPGYKDVGVTISAFSSLSIDPPQILFCLSKESKTLQTIHKASFFTVNILNKTQEKLSEIFSNHQPLDWQEIPSIPHQKSQCRLIKGALAHIICIPSTFYDGGDHEIIVGDVQELILGEEKSPLIRYDRQYLTTRSIIS